MSGIIPINGSNHELSPGQYRKKIVNFSGHNKGNTNKTFVDVTSASRMKFTRPFVYVRSLD